MKVDCQAGVGLVGSRMGGGPAAALRAHTALEDSIAGAEPRRNGRGKGPWDSWLQSHSIAAGRQQRSASDLASHFAGEGGAHGVLSTAPPPAPARSQL